MITPVMSPPQIMCAFPVGDEQRVLHISVLENGDVDFDGEEDVKKRLGGLLEGAGVGVCIELLRKTTG
jgi:hypothetical protein